VNGGYHVNNKRAAHVHTLIGGVLHSLLPLTKTNKENEDDVDFLAELEREGSSDLFFLSSRREHPSTRDSHSIKVTFFYSSKMIFGNDAGEEETTSGRAERMSTATPVVIGSALASLPLPLSCLCSSSSS
jgi:hypothetical protein